jgi:hypothetical protein
MPPIADTLSLLIIHKAQIWFTTFPILRAFYFTVNMAECSFLRNPGRTIHAGVFLVGGVTELIDVMPMDLLHSMNKKFIEEFAEVFGKKAVDQALDMEFHWVNETGKTAKLTTNIMMEATVNSSLV